MDIKAGEDYLTLPEAIEPQHYSSLLIIYSNGNPERNPESFARRIIQIPFGDMVEMKAKLPVAAEITGVPTQTTFHQPIPTSSASSSPKH